MVKGFEPNLLDKLFDNEPRNPASPVLKRLNIEELKDMVARDVECLLNTRIIFNEDDLKGFEQCKRSASTYGLNDFAGLSLASFNDRVYICRSIENAIARHETRLKNVKVSLEGDHRSINSLHFSIHAMLEVNPAKEQVSFDALLQPSSQKYSVSKSRRMAGG